MHALAQRAAHRPAGEQHCSTEICGQTERDSTAYHTVISHTLIIKKINNILAIRYL